VLTVGQRGISGAAEAAAAVVVVIIIIIIIILTYLLHGAESFLRK
jgi:uncharacterized membrane protein YtjA (UPF0391 family)